MDAKPYAHVVDGKVVNVSLWDGATPVERPANVTVVPLPYTTDDEGVRHYQGGIGWDYQDGQFVDNRPKPEDPDA